MPTRIFVSACLLGGTACASTPEVPDVAPVPVYAPSEVPCEYEVVRTVRVRRPTGYLSAAQFEQRMRDLLGRAAAQAGADAAIADLNPSGVARRREVGSLSPPPSSFVEAPAIRFIPGTCGGGR